MEETMIIETYMIVAAGLVLGIATLVIVDRWIGE